MQIIPLSKGMVALVDDDDHPWLSTMTWCASLQRDRYYAKTPRGTYMHRLIMGHPDGIIDHKNGCTLDNRKMNLRVCNRSQNQQHGTKVIRSHNTTGFRGVVVDKRDGIFSAGILLNGKKKHLGRFRSPEDAARAYDKAARELHGEFATLNFP